MPARPRVQDLALERAAALRIELRRELRTARVGADLSLAAVATRAGMSESQASRIERGLAPSLTIQQAVRLGAAVGFDLSARLYPAGDPIRDAAHVALLARFRGQLHPGLVLMTEVPLPIPGDRRAWDGVVRGAGWSVAVEAETRVRDTQALDRRMRLKLRDAGFEALILLLRDSAEHRRLIRAACSRGGLRLTAAALSPDWPKAGIRAGAPRSSCRAAPRSGGCKPCGPRRRTSSGGTRPADLSGTR